MPCQNQHLSLALGGRGKEACMSAYAGTIPALQPRPSPPIPRSIKLHNSCTTWPHALPPLLAPISTPPLPLLTKLDRPPHPPLPPPRTGPTPFLHHLTPRTPYLIYPQPALDGHGRALCCPGHGSHALGHNLWLQHHSGPEAACPSHTVTAPKVHAGVRSMQAWSC